MNIIGIYGDPAGTHRQQHLELKPFFDDLCKDCKYDKDKIRHLVSYVYEIDLDDTEDYIVVIHGTLKKITFFDVFQGALQNKGDTRIIIHTP